MELKGIQPLISLLSYPEQFWSLINIRYKTNLKVKNFIFKKTFSKNPKVPLPLKNWLPEQSMALKTWLPEQNLSFKYWYRFFRGRGTLGFLEKVFLKIKYLTFNFVIILHRSVTKTAQDRTIKI